MTNMVACHVGQQVACHMFDMHIVASKVISGWPRGRHFKASSFLYHHGC